MAACPSVPFSRVVPQISDELKNTLLEDQGVFPTIPLIRLMFLVVSNENCDQQTIVVEKRRNGDTVPFPKQVSLNMNF